MSKKSAKIAALIEECRGGAHDAHYLGYFKLFNQQLFYESHDVLEEMWLPVRKETAGDFYKGLIQLAGAFVHLQKNRLKPSHALFTLAETNLRKYPARHEGLKVGPVLEMIAEWKAKLEGSEFQVNPYDPATAPKVELG